MRLIPSKFPLFPGGRRHSVHGIYLDGELRATRKSFDEAHRVATMAINHLGLHHTEFSRIDVRWVPEPQLEVSAVERQLEDALFRLRELEGYDPAEQLVVSYSRCDHTWDMNRSQLDFELKHYSNDQGEIRCNWCGRYGAPSEQAA